MVDAAHDEECEECEGFGVIESFEDRWCYLRECHYTVEVEAECPSCDGSGKKVHEDE